MEYQVVDHELMESLEYKGEYGRSYDCKSCKHFKYETAGYSFCSKQGLDVHWGNNVCRAFEPSIINPSAPKFNLDDYLEFLFSDFYRPYSVDMNIIIGSARLGEIVLDGGKLAKQSEEYKKYLEETEQWSKLFDYKPYSYMYKSYDKPYCRVHCNKRNYVRLNGNTFTIDYRRFRELKTIENGAIQFMLRQWKDKPKQRKSNSETNGIYKIESE